MDTNTSAANEIPADVRTFIDKSWQYEKKYGSLFVKVIVLFALGIVLTLPTGGISLFAGAAVFVGYLIYFAVKIYPASVDLKYEQTLLVAKYGFQYMNQFISKK